MEIEVFKTVVVSLQEKLFSCAKNILADNDDANDAVQETFLRLWSISDRLDNHPNIGGYAMQTIKNVCLDKIKQRKNNISFDNIQIGANSDNPYQNLENNNSVTIIRQIIELLPDLQRQIITMRDVEEYELSEIAEIMGSNVAAVKVNLSRARKKVRDSFIHIQSQIVIQKQYE